MANIYLEKIAGIVDAAKYVGRKAMLALGGGQREYIGKTIKGANPRKIMQLGEKFNSLSTRKQLLRAKIESANPGMKFKDISGQAKREATNSLRTDLKGLHEQKIDARIIAGTGVAGGVIAHKKYKETHPDNNYPATYYENYQQ